MLRILVVQDKLGITPAYMGHWNMMTLKAGLMQPWIKISLTTPWRKFSQNELLSFSKQRKTPGFNTDPKNQIKILNWLKDEIDRTSSHIVVFMCPSMFFIVNNHWDQATTEKLRGGVYTIKDSQRRDIQVLVTTPISAINQQMKAKDIAALNQGISERDEFEEVYASSDDNGGEDGEDDSDSENRIMEWYNPIVVPYGRHCFQSDLFKLGRLARRWKEVNDSLISRQSG